MGDDAEYQMELDAEDARANALEREAALLPHSRSLYVWSASEWNGIWEWVPAGRVPGVFAALAAAGVGDGYCRTGGLPDILPNLAYLDEHVVSDSAPEVYEVLVLGAQDLAALDLHVKQFSSPDQPLRERVLAEMFETLADYVRRSSGDQSHIFAREV